MSRRAVVQGAYRGPGCRAVRCLSLTSGGCLVTLPTMPTLQCAGSADAGKDLPRGKAMRCPSCGSENPDGVNFCGACGTQLSVLGRAAGDEDDIPGYAWGALPQSDLGAIINTTLETYRAHFWLFFGIAAVVQAVLFIGERLAALGAPWVFLGGGPLLAGVVVSVASGPATAYAVVARSILGRRVGLGDCYARALKYILHLLGALIIVVLALIIPAVLSVILIGIPVLLLLAVRWLFWGQAIVIEGLGPVGALQRSWYLVEGSWWRVFGIALVFLLISIALSIPVLIVSSLVGLASDFVGSLVGAAGTALITPVGFIGMTLLYLDLRVRREGLEVETLAAGLAE